MPLCQRCRVEKVSAESDLCLTCLDQLIDESLAQAQREQQLTDADEKTEKRLTESWLRNGIPLKEAQRIIKDSADIAHIIASNEFASVIMDKQAIAEFRKLFIAGHPTIFNPLAKYARRRLKRKRGRKPKGPEADYAKVHKLREKRLSFGKIALRLWNDSSKANLARAHYYRALKSGLPPIQLPSGNEK